MPHRRPCQPQQTSTASQIQTLSLPLSLSHRHTHMLRLHCTTHASVALTFCDDRLVAQPMSLVGTTSLYPGVREGRVFLKGGEHFFFKPEKRKKENKARLKSSHRQARAPGVLSQARNYRTGSTAKCFIKGNSPPNSWRWAPASCVCLLVAPSAFLSSSSISIHPSPAALHLALGEPTDRLPWTTEIPLDAE